MVVAPRIFAFNNTIEMGASPIRLLSDFHLFCIAIVLIFFYPLLFLIRYFAAKAKEKSISLITTFLMIVCTLWLLVNIVVILIALFS